MENHFYEILNKQKDFDLYRDYCNLRNKFYFNKIYLDNPYPGEVTLFNILDEDFKNVKFNDGSYETLWDFENLNKLSFRMDKVASDNNYYLLFCEYIINLLNNYDFNEKELKVYASEITDFIYKSIAKLKYIKAEKDNTIIFIPKDEILIDVAKKVEPSLREKILIYSHHSTKGDLTAKRDILNSLALELEPQRNSLSSLASNLTSDLFAAFNNFSIRHNNSTPTDPTKYNEKFTLLSEPEKEEIYDFVFQYCIIALKLLDNKKCKELIDNYKK